MSRKDPMMIAEIMKNNFKGAFSNPIVVIVLIGVIILPSLYALLNIQACWDPYGNTGDVPFAIANLDDGASFNYDINIDSYYPFDNKIKITINSNGHSFQKMTCERACITEPIMRELSYPKT